jgi:hypothetical protein
MYDKNYVNLFLMQCILMILLLKLIVEKCLFLYDIVALFINFSGMSFEERFC